MSGVTFIPNRMWFMNWINIFDWQKKYVNYIVIVVNFAYGLRSFSFTNQTFIKALISGRSDLFLFFHLNKFRLESSDDNCHSDKKNKWLNIILLFQKTICAYLLFVNGSFLFLSSKLTWFTIQLLLKLV